MIKTCGICSKESKYKCPICFIHYCSVSCCKQHKVKECHRISVSKDVDQGEEQTYKKRKIETDSVVPVATLDILKINKEVKELLDNPHLRNLLVTIDNAENAEDIMQKAMLEPIFVEFADACLRVVDPKEETGD